MGWAGPAQNGLGRSRPKKRTSIPFWARPGPEGRAGPGSAWPSNQNGRGELFSPHPCMQNAIRSACRKGKKNEYRNEGEEELPGAEEAVALVLLVLLEAVLVLVLLEVEAVDSRTAAVALLLVAEREVLPPPLSSVSFPFRFLSFLLLLWFSFPPFSFLSVLSSSSPLSLSFGFFVLLHSPLFFSFFPLSPPPVFSVLWSIYRAKGRGFLWLHMGSKGCGGWSAIWVQLSRFRSLFFG